MKHTKTFSFATTLALLLLSAPAWAEEPLELVTDRPDFTESASAVPVGHVQLELGAELGGAESFLALGGPNLLLRTGIADQMEIRLALPSVSGTKPDGGDWDVDYGSAGLGFKFVFPVLPDVTLALLPSFSAPVEPDAFDAAGMEIGLNFIWAYAIDEDWSLSGNIVGTVGGIAADAPGVDVESAYAISVSAGYGVTDELGLFLESINHISQDGDFDPFLDGGLTYLLTAQLQLDAYAGFLLKDPADGWFVGTGVSMLF